MPVADRRSPGERDDAVARAGETTTTTTTTTTSTASAREQPLLHIKHLNPLCKQNTSKHHAHVGTVNKINQWYKTTVHEPQNKSK